MRQTTEQNDSRDPLWWSTDQTRLAVPPGALHWEVLKARAVSRALAGDYDLWNRMEFGPAIAHLATQLQLHLDQVAGEPVVSTNGRMVGLRLFRLYYDSYEDQDGCIHDVPCVDTAVWASWSADGQLLRDGGLVAWAAMERQY